MRAQDIVSIVHEAYKIFLDIGNNDTLIKIRDKFLTVTPMMENMVLNLQITLLDIKICPIVIAVLLNDKIFLVLHICNNFCMQ